MLVALFNVVKVESVPLKSIFLAVGDWFDADQRPSWAPHRRCGSRCAADRRSVDCLYHGIDAGANVRFVAANHEDAETLDIDFLREGAEWKACRYHAARSV